ncbi:uncharacterized protein LOC112904367 [Agrilus planipennis]|uniref:Uncharacterized protein LOC112904367 n=1 Tax=Agrilus planipennis TaxID=224129 RepID=A0A7F5R3S0_AGRPL|nr:uncharacterized protein LOC112904367 [Agrilus planipennis]
MDGGSYFERATCLNVTVTCTEKLMAITFTPEMNFKGKLYLQGYSEHSECYSVGQGYRMVMLKIPLLDQHCGLTVARSKGLNNRTLLSANMVLQYNPLIQAQGDRLIRVGCIFSNDN